MFVSSLLAHKKAFTGGRKYNKFKYSIHFVNRDYDVSLRVETRFGHNPFTI